jgi:hypothetical protein
LSCRAILADELLNFDRAWIADDDGLKRYDKLLAMHERESRGRIKRGDEAADYATGD